MMSFSDWKDWMLNSKKQKQQKTEKKQIRKATQWSKLIVCFHFFPRTYNHCQSLQSVQMQLLWLTDCCWVAHNVISIRTNDVNHKTLNIKNVHYNFPRRVSGNGLFCPTKVHYSKIFNSVQLRTIEEFQQTFTVQARSSGCLILWNDDLIM